jgi:hypothetical protein
MNHYNDTIVRDEFSHFYGYIMLQVLFWFSKGELFKLPQGRCFKVLNCLSELVEI